MKAKFTFAWLALMLGATLILPAGGAARSAAPAAATGAEVFAYYDFEQSVKPWTPMSDSPDHNFALTQQSGTNGCSAKGSHYAQLSSLPKAPPDLAFAPPLKYATWTVANFAVSGAGARQVSVQWSAKWSWVSGMPPRAYPAVYVGTKPPTSVLDFTILPNGNLTGWQPLSYQTYIKLMPTPSGEPTPVYVAVGWDNVGGSMDLDCLNIAITYPPTAK